MTSKEYVCTENDVQRIWNRIHSNTVIDGDCLVWKGKSNIIKYTFDDRVKRNVNLTKFVIDPTIISPDVCKKIIRSCGNFLCLNKEHLSLKNTCPIDRILSYTTENPGGCLIHKNGEYVIDKINGVSMSSHRAIFMLVKNDGNPIPKYNDDGDPLVVRHMCGDGRCVNPEHLKLGTESQNMYDDQLKNGKLMRGEKHHKTTLTEEVVTKIKHSKFPLDHPEYLTQQKRAEKFNTTLATVSLIDRNASWSHIPDRDGNIYDKSNKRKRTREYSRKKREEEWFDQDYVEAGKKIRSNITESSQNKGGLNPNGDCWEWKKSTNKYGYGRVFYKYKNTNSHILSCEVKYKRRLQKGEVVRHLCSNRICCNPDHLEFGTASENVLDTLMSGKNKFSKLTPRTVIDIYKSSKPTSQLFVEYGVSKSCITAIRSRRTWKEITKNLI